MRTANLMRLCGVAAALAALAGPLAAQQPAPIENMPAISGNVDANAATDRIERSTTRRANESAMQGRNPYTGPHQPAFRPTFTGTGANTHLVAPGAHGPIVVPPPAPPPPCVPGPNRSC